MTDFSRQMQVFLPVLNVLYSLLIILRLLIELHFSNTVMSEFLFEKTRYRPVALTLRHLQQVF